MHKILHVYTDMIESPTTHFDQSVVTPGGKLLYGRTLGRSHGDGVDGAKLAARDLSDQCAVSHLGE